MREAVGEPPFSLVDVISRIESVDFESISRAEATVVRTAGGRVQSALNSLLVLSAVGNAGKKGVIMVVHHTDCGLQSISDDGIKEILRENAGSEVGVEVLEGMKFGSFTK